MHPCKFLCYIWALVYERRGEVDAGQYAFPFRFTLPPDIPGSFNVREGDVYASVTYKIKAEVSHRDARVLDRVMNRLYFT